MFVYWVFVTSVTPRLEQAAVDILSPPTLFVLVGVFFGVEEPLRWCGVNTQGDRPCVKRSRRQSERQTGPNATALGLGLGKGLVGTLDPSSAEKVRAQA